MTKWKVPGIQSHVSLCLEMKIISELVLSLSPLPYWLCQLINPIKIPGCILKSKESMCKPTNSTSSRANVCGLITSLSLFYLLLCLYTCLAVVRSNLFKANSYRCAKKVHYVHTSWARWDFLNGTSQENHSNI